MPLEPKPAKAARRYPACAIDEYASIRLTFCWRSAARFPMVMERTATIQSTGDKTARMVGNISYTTRSRNAKAAALGAVDIKATTGEGAPSYTSGVQTWKGAADTLKPRPIRIMATASVAKPGVGLFGRAAATSLILVVPVAPKVNAMP